MTGKITAALVAAILLGSAGVASAQVGRTGPTYSPYYGPYYYSPYYNGAYWRGIQGVAPYRGVALFAVGAGYLRKSGGR